MKRGQGETVPEPARDLPVFGHCDVLVVGGGPAGLCAAIAAAREGADVVLLERYGHLGGLSTGGLVFWIDRMTDWQGNLIVAGIGQEMIERAGAEATLGPPRELWGSTDPTQAAFWRERTSALRGVVQWSPTVDPEVLKLVSNDLVREAGVTTLLHCWAVAALKDGGHPQTPAKGADEGLSSGSTVDVGRETVTGVVFESKEGRKALLAKVVIDCTGDGDVFALAGAGFENDFDDEGAHARINTSWRFGNVDMRRYLDFRMIQPREHSELMAKAQAAGINIRAHPTPYDSVALFMTPKMSGYSALSVEDLTAVEFRSRDIMRDGLAWFRNNVPGFERAWILDSASQIGTRHARRLAGVERVTLDHWRNDGAYDDSIGLCPSLTPIFPTLEIPYRSLVPERMDGMLAAGRNSSCDTRAHAALREVPECWVMGEAAGLAAAMAVASGVPPRDVSVPDLQARLSKQGAIVRRHAGAGPTTRAEDAYEDFKGSIHFSTPGLEPAKGKG